METLKEVLSICATVIGILSAVIPLCARLIDKKKAKRRRVVYEILEDDEEALDDDGAPPQPVRRRTREETAYEDRWQVPPLDRGELQPSPRDLGQVAAARGVVAPAAIAMILVGCLGFFSNFFMAGFGYVDEFIMPLGSDERIEERAAKRVEDAAKPGNLSDQNAAVVVIIMFFSFGVASGMAIWAGFNMYRLRSYWLSVAGSFAVMAGGCACMLIGVPIGIWALVVLMRPDVREAFRIGAT